MKFIPNEIYFQKVFICPCLNHQEQAFLTSFDKVLLYYWDTNVTLLGFFICTTGSLSWGLGYCWGTTVSLWYHWAGTKA